MNDDDLYECMLLGCDFIGSQEQCTRHMVEHPGHDEFWSVPTWAELARGRAA